MIDTRLVKTSRTTSVKITSLVDASGYVKAEDMHGITCFIDHRTHIDSTPSLGLFFDADICSQGFVIQARSLKSQS